MACASGMHQKDTWSDLNFESHPKRGQSGSFPLFPTWEGLTAAKHVFIDAIRLVIRQTGTELGRPGPSGSPMHRFHGHCLPTSMEAISTRSRS